MSFSIKSDLARRSSAQQAEILAISGPTAQRNMLLLSQGKLAEFKALTGVVVSTACAATLVAKYGKLILR